MTVAFVALGSNLGDRVAYLRQARQAASGLATRVAASSLYETAPVGPPQPRYLNAVLRLELAPSVTPQQLLAWALSTEKLAGRVREERWGPRTLDIDVLTFDQLTLQSDALTLPHPAMADRAFVLVPLLQIAPSFVLNDGTLASARLALLGRDGIEVFADPRWPV